jgi:Xaa-Pro dipeptidase
MPAGLMENVGASGAVSLIPAVPDLARMRRERTGRVRSIMQNQGLDALVLLGNTNVIYASGAVWPLADSGRTHFEQPVAVVFADDEYPHVWSPVHDDERLRADIPADHLHGPVYLDFDEGVAAFAGQLGALADPGAAIAIDEWTHALRRDGYFFGDRTPLEGGKVISRAKLVKTSDELSCMRTSLQITEEGIAEVQAQLAPGVRQTDLTATFLRTIFDHGADANILEPIWQVMTPSMSDGPWTTTGGLACPLLSTERELVEGDVLWVDTCVTWNGYHSDFGRTWIVGREPDARQREQFEQWRAIMTAVLDVTRAGASAADLTAAAISVTGGDKPWMSHFYLGHGLGIDSAEMPFVGSDIGEAFDSGLVLQAGSVLVLEPIVWDDGDAGYRSEEVVLITEDGWEPMTDYPYDPYGAVSEPLHEIHSGTP